MTIANCVLDPFERPPPIDQADRDRLLSDLDGTFFVEAGAGTGKTRVLVERIVALVAAGRLEMERLAAITFTEAAAAELRSRIRRDLEGTAANLCRPEIVRQRCRKATEQVDLANIQTIHAFAATLLRTFPIEAELPPGFEVWDAVKAELTFDERFRAWLWDEVPSVRSDDRARREDIRRALLLGITFNHLRDLAEALQEHNDLLDRATAGAPESLPDARSVARRRGQEILELEELFCHSKLGDDDPLIREFRRHQLEVVRLAASVDENDALVALLAVGKFNAQKGKQSDWTKDSTGQNAAKTIKASFKSVSDEIDETIAAYRRASLRAVLAHLFDFHRAFEQERRAQGAATFQDLLSWAARLLRDNLDVRQRAGRRFSHILVDEFQDTDPLQAEIIWLLAGDDPSSRVATWRDVALEPGKLFVVGDPKQSIYRFRRADIGLYSRIYADLPESARARLVENFRSVGAVIEWVNFQFTADMVGSIGVQAPYMRLHVPAVDGQVGGVHFIGDVVEGGAGKAWALEATDVARFARIAVADGWLVRNKPGDVIRAANYSDICVLLKTRTNVRNLEDAFEREGVPYRLESGSLVLDTPEVRDLLACLRAIDDPSDQVALVAALRSPAYGCSDVDLLDWVDRGGKLDCQQPHAGLDGAVAEALDSLGAFHLARVDRSVAATVETFLRERMLVVGVFDRARPREAWRRLRYVVSQARTLAAAGRDTLRALTDWLENLQRAQVRDVESPLPEADEDAVRVMTIHGAKGLEFPITVITGAGSAGGGTRGVTVLSDRESGTFAVKVGPFESAGYAEAKKQEGLMEAAEEIRLFYVAATRARDHLVLSLYHGTSQTGSAAARFLNGREALGAPFVDRLSFDARPPPVVGRREAAIAEVSPPDHKAAEDRWVSERATAIVEAGRSPLVTATELVRRAAGVGLANAFPERSPTMVPLSMGPTLNAPIPNLDQIIDWFLDDDDGERSGLDPDAPPADPTVDTAVSIGRAVHQALAESGPLQSPLLGRIVRRATAENNLPSRYVERVRDLVLAALRGPTIVAARSRPHWCEVSLGIDLDDTILSGRIDLVVENLDGSLGIVDYKTDLVEADAVAHHARIYRVQAGAYALGLTEITGKSVSSVTLIFAALNGAEVRWDDIDALVAEARVMLG